MKFKIYYPDRPDGTVALVVNDTVRYEIPKFVFNGIVEALANDKGSGGNPRFLACPLGQVEIRYCPDSAADELVEILARTGPTARLYYLPKWLLDELRKLRC